MTSMRQLLLVSCTTVVLALALAPTGLLSQQSAAPKVNPSPADLRTQLFGDLIDTIKRNKRAGNEVEAENALDETVNPFMIWTAGLSVLRAEVQDWRTDVQTENPPSGRGTTSVVSKGSVPYLLGLAVENGALTQMTSGTSVTFRTNPTGLITALQKHGYAESGPNAYTDPVIKFVKNFSATVTFNTGATTGATTTGQGSQTQAFATAAQQISSFDVRYDIYNHRDPRDRKYNARWEALRAEQLGELAVNAQQFAARLRGVTPVDPEQAKKYKHWLDNAKARVAKADVNAPDSASDSVQTAVFAVADDFVNTFGSDPAVKSLASAGSQALSDYLKTTTKIRDLISKSPIVTLEYTDMLQGSITTAMASANPQATTTSAKLPSLSNFKLIVAGGTGLGITLTSNASLTIFNSIPAGTKTGRVRDFQLSGEVDVPITEIKSLGVPTVTFSGLFLSLQQQPLGMPIEVNGVPVNMKGNLGLAQAKITFPVKKGSGVQVPLSITYASRTEFNREHDVSGQIGVTFNLDSVFAAMKP